MLSLLLGSLALMAARAIPLEPRHDGEDHGMDNETCEITEYQGHISLWDGDQPVCLTVVGDHVENGVPVAA